jgi:hypothetical protein
VRGLGHLHLKELFKKVRMRAREAQVDAARRLLYLVEQCADALALAIALAGDLLVVGQDAGGAAEVDIEVAALHALHGAETISPWLAPYSATTETFSASRIFWMMTCLAVCAAMRP